MTDVRKLLADALVQAAMEDDKSQKVTVSMRVLEIMVAGATDRRPSLPNSLTNVDLMYMTVAGERLRGARRSAGITVRDMAARLKMSESGIRNQENGTNGIPAALAPAYAEAYGVSPEWILFGRGEGPHVDDPVNGDTTG